MHKVKKKDIWTIKYRPNTLNEICGNEESISVIQKLIDSKNLPHLVLHGPKDSGKSSAAFAIAFELYDEYYERNFTYFNASDFFDQGKRYLVRDERFKRIIGTDDPKKIKGSVISIFKKILNEYSSIRPIDCDYKIIFIDSAESLNSDAQHALRRIMEKYTETCRYILSTTQPSKLIPALRSRGVNLFFRYVSDSTLKNHIKKISNLEQLNLTDDGKNSIAYHAQGNIANAVLTLQLASLLSKDIDAQIVYETILSKTPGEILNLFEMLKLCDVINARIIIDSLIIAKGLSGQEILEQLYGVVIESNESEMDIAKIVKRLADIDFYLTESANPRIQLEALISGA